MKAVQSQFNLNHSWSQHIHLMMGQMQGQQMRYLFSHLQKQPPTVWAVSSLVAGHCLHPATVSDYKFFFNIYIIAYPLLIYSLYQSEKYKNKKIWTSLISRKLQRMSENKVRILRCSPRSSRCSRLETSCCHWSCWPQRQRSSSPPATPYGSAPGEGLVDSTFPSPQSPQPTPADPRTWTGEVHGILTQKVLDID